MQGGSSIRGSNSSGACFSRHCGDPFIAVALKKRRRHALFCFFVGMIPKERLCVIFVKLKWAGDVY